MKKGLVLFFFLILFTQCEKTGINPLAETPVNGISGDAPAGFSGGTGNSNGRTFQPLLQQHPSGKRKKRGTGKVSMPLSHTGSEVSPAIRIHDTSMIGRLKFLRANRIEPDLNEPGNRNILLSQVDNMRFESMITLSRERFLRVNFDNDILDYTDRFYTNGIKIEYIAPALQTNPLSRLLVPYRGSGTNYYGLSVVQNMYTPSTTKTGGIKPGDRPYSAYLYVGSFKITNNPAGKYRQTSGIDLGIIGQNSYGEWVQRSFHNNVPTNNEPLGWEYQVQNDLVLNYSVSLEKGIVSGRNFELLANASGSLGTLYTNISAGGRIRAGWFNPYFANLGVAKKKTLEDEGLRRSQFFLFLKGSAKAVGYDATLQGGMFNKSSAYTLQAADISRVVFEGSVGASFSSNGIRVDLEQFMLSPEFRDGLWHKWVHIALTFNL